VLREDKPHVPPFVGPAWYVAGAWVVAALIVQTTGAHYLAVRGVVPSLVLVAVVWYAIRVNARRAVIYGLFAGFCEDALSTQTGAAWMISTGLSALVASRLSRGFFADSLPLATGITIVATLLRALVFWVVMALVGYPSGLGALHFHEAVLQAALNAGTIVFVMLAARRIEAARS
jgi:rod shape-determining protein MreD